MYKFLFAIFLSFALACPVFAQYTPPGGTVTTGQANSAFGGNGSGGALLLSATETNIIQYNGTTVSVADGATETLKSGSVINASSTLTIGGGASGVLTVGHTQVGGAGGAATGAGNTGKNCEPPYWTGGTAVVLLAGTGGTYGLGGGGGAGGAGWAGSSQGGASGGGGSGAGAIANGYGGSTMLNGLILPTCTNGGTGGAGAGGQGSSNAAKFGGGNSGKATLCAAGAITIATGASCNANGGAGDASVTPDVTGHGGGGAGGGSGGVLSLYSLVSITATGTASANGGAGGNGGAAKVGSAGNGGGGGGGGGPGAIVRMSPSNGGGGTYQAIGGAGGGAGAKDGVGTIGTAGSTNTGTTGVALSITGTPNFPLIVMHEKYLGGAFGQLAEMKKDAHGNYNADMKEHCSMMAALECQQRGLDGICFQQLQHHFYTSTEWVPNNAVAILNSPDKVQAKLDAFTCETLTNPEHGMYCGGLGEVAGDRT